MKTVESTKSYVFPVTVEPDGAKWRAYVPELESKGAATWGHTREEALKNIQEVLQMVVGDKVEDGEPVSEAVKSISLVGRRRESSAVPVNLWEQRGLAIQSVEPPLICGNFFPGNEPFGF